MTNDVDRVRRIGAHSNKGDDPSGSLSERVSRARIRGGLTLTDLHRRSGLSLRTLRDIEAGNPRRYSPSTLARLDNALGWEPGTAYEVWTSKAQPPSPDERLTESMREAIAEQMALLANRLATLEEAPPWQSEVVDAFRLLRPEDRTRLLDLARRLGEGATWR